MSVGLLFEEAGSGGGVAVVAVVGVNCSVVWHGSVMFAVVLLLVLSEGGLGFKPVIRLWIF